MLGQWEKDQSYLDKKFCDRNFYDNSPGIPLAAIDSMLDNLASAEENFPIATAKANAVALLFKNTRIAVSSFDFFPGLEFAMSRPVSRSHLSRWGAKLWQRMLTGKERDELKTYDQVHLAHIYSDYNHAVPDWDAILELGFSGLLDRAVKYKEKHKASGNFTGQKRIYFEAIEIVYGAILVLLDRLISEAAKLPAQPKGRCILEALTNLRRSKAGNFYEALLQIWLFFLLCEYGDNIQTRSFGNLDRILYPYYQKDLETGKFTREEIRYFIRSFMYQATAMHYKVGHPFYFGGTGEDGGSEINELSYLILDEYEKMKIFDPKLQIKVSENTPEDFIKKALNMIRNNCNSIVFVGEPCIIRTMLKNGYTKREGETADIKGCYEYCARGGTVETAPVTVNLVKILGITLHNGMESVSRKELGIKTGTLETFDTFAKLYKAFLKQLFHLCEHCIQIADKMESNFAGNNPAPMYSATFESSLKSAVDGYARGAIYNNSNLWLCGVASAGDSLTMIKKYVYDLKIISLKDFVNILDSNFSGHEVFRSRLLNDPEKFGNDLEFPDKITVHLSNAVARRFNMRSNARGGFYTTSLHASNRFFEWAPTTEASADGRLMGDELSKNMTASQGCAYKGATALVNSVLKFDSSRFMGNIPVDVMLHPSEVRGPAGLNAMYSLLMTFIKNYGHAMQFNVLDPDILRQAQKEPEKFRHLQVRICGWNVYWNSISKLEQDAYIRQAERL